MSIVSTQNGSAREGTPRAGSPGRYHRARIGATGVLSRSRLGKISACDDDPSDGTIKRSEGAPKPHAPFAINSNA
ncbi:hypothetical protein HRV97_00225 [Sphingomonas sp. HHU CXW]|uniref:Uncharacterized protein n=1 Tax=Sphingomonas hominis TaxID=2741495 RepID=A0ABX2JG42_9SPHN|nr:hypothetical protein [Sphingomonas hominis]NTS63581.1 hypothetical protein [Sphingomonas hominis]